MAAARARRQLAPKAAPVLAPARPAFGAYRVEQLGFCQCRYPDALVGGQHRFCGRPTTVSQANKHGSWCDEHMAVVFTPRVLIGARKTGGA